MALAEQRIADSDWVYGMFGLRPRARDEQTRSSRRYTNMHFNFADTTLGGSQAINCPPQFTVNCDPPFSGLFARPTGRSRAERVSRAGIAYNDESLDNPGTYAMGPYFFESIYDNAHFAHFRFGVPKYAGIVNFFANNYDPHLAHLAKTGNYSTIARNLGKWVGVAGLYGVLGPIGLISLFVTSQTLKAVLNRNPSSYYYLKPTMHSYLKACQYMADTQGLHYRLFPMTDFLGREWEDSEIRQDLDMDEIYKAMPDIWKSGKKFDIYRMLNRYQILANYQANTIEKIYEEASDQEDLYKRLGDYLFEARNNMNKFTDFEKGQIALADLDETYSKMTGYNQDFDEMDMSGIAKHLDQTYMKEELTDRNLEAEQNSERSVINTDEAKTYTNETFWEGIIDYVGDAFTQFGEQGASEIVDGGQWVSWMVSNKDSYSETFSNTSKEPEISSSLKGISSTARNIEVSTSGGKTGFGLVDEAMSGIKQFFAGVGDAFHLTGLMSLYNAAVIDFPEVWESSSSSQGDVTLNFPLVSWSGNDFDLYQNIQIPIIMWLAAAIPLSTGKQSFTHPFYVEAYSPGKFCIRKGLITGLSITRGVGNTPFKKDGKMLGATLQVTIRDMSRVTHMPLVRDANVFDNDSKFSDYMSVLGSASLFEMTNSLTKLSFNANQKWQQSIRSFFMVGNTTSYLGNLAPTRILAGMLAGSNYR